MIEIKKGSGSEFKKKQREATIELIVGLVGLCLVVFGIVIYNTFFK